MALPSLPEPHQLATIFSQALAPAFLLGAISILTGGLSTRLQGVTDRLRVLKEIADGDSIRGKLKADIPLLKFRATLLKKAAFMTLTAGVVMMSLLVIWVISAFLGLQHIYGGVLLFMIACLLLGLSLFNFAREVRISLVEFDHL